MYFKIAFRNLFRYKRMNLLIGIVITISSAILVIVGSYINGINTQLSDMFIKSIGGHLIIRSQGAPVEILPTYEKLPWKFFIDDPNRIKKIVGCYQQVDTVTERTKVNAFILGENDKMVFINLVGIDPQKEERFIFEQISIKKGTKDILMNGIVVSERIFAQLKADIGSTVCVVGYTEDGALRASKFILSGIFEPKGWKMMTEFNVYCNIEKLKNLFEIDDKTMDIIVYLNDLRNIYSLKQKLNQEFQCEKINVQVSTWEESGRFFLGIVFATIASFVFTLFVLFCITGAFLSNNMIICIFERTKEIGTMSALGMKKIQILKLLISEGVILSGIFAILGIIIGSIISWWLSMVGLPSWGEAMTYVYGGERLYFVLKIENILLCFFIIIVSAILSSFCPAYKIASIKPAEVFRRSEKL